MLTKGSRKSCATKKILLVQQSTAAELNIHTTQKKFYSAVVHHLVFFKSGGIPFLVYREEIGSLSLFFWDCLSGLNLWLILVEEAEGGLFIPKV